MNDQNKVNQDLEDERRKISFKVEDFTKWYYGGDENVDEKKFLENIYQPIFELNNSIDMSYMSHKEKYEEAIRRATIVLKKVKEIQAQGQRGKDLYNKVFGNLGITSIFREGSPIGLHFSMFLPALRKLATVEQQAEWISRAWNLSIIGTYAQTEMGHGTFIRGLETTATYDTSTKEFVLHSPTITAYKWWPGSLGHTANYAIVFAQLYTLGKHHGLQPFIVQLRDEETHKPMKGITIGELGNKVGFNTVNNGFLGFDHVRIPLKNMLMKNAKVLDNGEFIRQKSSILTYGAMTLVRVRIVKDQAFYLSKAVTVAMRYALVRHQSPIEPDQPEPKIIEHVTQQMKIFPSITKTIVMQIAADSLNQMYLEVNLEVEKGDLSRLPELHALSCCLKAVCSNETVQAVEVCRLACGGHGYLNSSGFNDVFKMVTSAQTYEGENTVLLLQTARFLIKAYDQAVKGGRVTPSVSYLTNYVSGSNSTIEWNDLSPEGMLRALEIAAAGKIALAYKHVEMRKKFCSAEEAANQTGIELTKAAELHCQVFLLKSAITSLSGAGRSTPALALVLKDVLELFSVDLAVRLLGNLLQFVNIKSENIEKLHSMLESSLKKLRFNAIGIVDGFDIPDFVLGSTLGAYDGNVYERLLSEAKKSPLNQEDVNKSFHLNATAAQTYEGENTVLLLQTARYLIKAYGQVLNGEKLPPTVEYLKVFDTNTKYQWNDLSPEGILRALEITAAGKIALAYKHVEMRKKFCSAEEAANQTGIELTKAAELHCQVFLLKSAITSLSGAGRSTPALALVLKDVLELFSVDLAVRLLGNLLQFVNIKSENIEKLHSMLESSLKKLRFNAIGIVDGFDIPDFVLGSTLGAYDGNVYERLLSEAKKSPLNQEDVNKSFHLQFNNKFNINSVFNRFKSEQNTKPSLRIKMNRNMKVNPDLQEERDKISFKVQDFTNWYYGGEESVKEKKTIENLFFSKPELQINNDMSYMSHKEKYEEAIRRTVLLLKTIKELQSEGQTNIFNKRFGWDTFDSFIKEGSPIALHYGVFIPALKKLGTEDQQAEWISRAWNLSIIGTYAQTEMGHGTFIRGLETTATYDTSTKEFVLHSPTITAYKWWPGSLGHTANYAIVFAQLYTLGKHHGIQPFIVQLRDEETHKPLKGITIGDIGNKIGLNTIDNGFLGFDHVRIPLKNMLMKNAKIIESGEFIRQKSSVLNYGTMTLLRVGIVKEQSIFLSKAVTIAMRYALVRRQSPIEPDQPEPKIIEHVTQQMKIFPEIAKVLAIKSAADNLNEMYVEVTSDMEKGNLFRLSELHALSCCLKAVCTKETSFGVEVCRLACGGHGYLNSSGFNIIYRNATAAQTYEGENTVLLLQTARYLIKAYGQVLNGEKLPPTVEYLKVSDTNTKYQWNDLSPEGILRALEIAAAGKIALAYKHVEIRKKFCSAEEAANQTGIELTKAAELHCQVFLLKSAITSLSGAGRSTPALALVLKDVLELFSVDLAVRLLGNLLQFVNIKSENIEKLHSMLESSLKKLRFNAIGIVDGFDIPDFVLGSTLGAYDGNVYERLLSEAKKSPLNQEDVNKSFHLYLKPFMKSNFFALLVLFTRHKFGILSRKYLKMSSTTKVNRDLQDEREKVTFNVEEFTNWYHGGAQNVKDKKSIENFFLSDPELHDTIDMSYMSHKEKYEEAIRRTTVMLRKLKKMQSEGQGDILNTALGWTVFSSLLKEGSPIGLHYGMFLPALKKLGTIGQQSEWISRAWNLSIIGTYAQTEMGHGTFIRGLETTATYDTSTKEFVLHSPTITAYKVI
ncbi:CLUMA_CG016522, isoform B [Clunio marinus]|uniref:CLUMA_CG016522, isoform B n=1 Tax=Clunio marinus TaxID=568069 RepID=A0A1J1ISZ9_9DIPT|nr:CLUMA_CG016522, isoform B [Clunio marinus]